MQGPSPWESEPYMQHHRPWQRSGAGPLFPLHGKPIHLCFKMRVRDQRKDRNFKVHIHINKQDAIIEKY